MFSPLRQSRRRRLEQTVVVAAFALWSMSGTMAFAQGGGGIFGRGFSTSGYANRGYYPYYSYAGATPIYNLYGNYGVYGYPGSGIEGGASNSGYDPGYGGYPSYGGYGLVNSSPVTAPAFGAPNTAPVQQRLLGIDEDPVVVGDGVKAMKVAKVYPGTAAEKAGLQAGDVIRSVNGYLTEQRGNLAWIIARTPGNELKLTVQAAKDGQSHQITAILR